MVIVGSRGLGKLKGILLGSTSHYLVQKSSVPVMVSHAEPSSACISLILGCSTPSAKTSTQNGSFKPTSFTTSQSGFR
jgi:hypothetical protein